jgi:hypothetical protein
MDPCTLLNPCWLLEGDQKPIEAPERDKRCRRDVTLKIHHTPAAINYASELHLQRNHTETTTVSRQ